MLKVPDRGYNTDCCGKSDVTDSSDTARIGNLELSRPIWANWRNFGKWFDINK